MGIHYSLFQNGSNLNYKIKEYIRKKDYTNAISCLEILAETNNLDAIMDLSKIYLEMNDIKTAKKYLKMAVEQATNGEAMYLLGQLYYNESKSNKAVKLFSFAYQLNYMPAIYMFGKCFKRGIGLMFPNEDKAKELFTIGMDRHCPKCICALGSISYAKGNIKDAHKYFEQAIKYDSPKAYYYLGKLYYAEKQKSIGKSYNQVACNKDYTRAMWYMTDICINENDLVNAIKYIMLCIDRGYLKIALSIKSILSQSTKNPFSTKENRKILKFYLQYNTMENSIHIGSLGTMLDIYNYPRLTVLYQLNKTLEQRIGPDIDLLLSDHNQDDNVDNDKNFIEQEIEYLEKINTLLKNHLDASPDSDNPIAYHWAKVDWNNMINKN